MLQQAHVLACKVGRWYFKEDASSGTASTGLGQPPDQFTVPLIEMVIATWIA
jgi:hypothetical protein